MLIASDEEGAKALRAMSARQLVSFDGITAILTDAMTEAEVNALPAGIVAYRTL